MALRQDDFRALIERHQSMVFSIALRVLGEHGTAEEVAQDVFVELFRTPKQPETDDHLRFWLRRVAVHRATDALRSRGRRPEANAEEWMEEAHTPVDRMSDAEGTGLEERLRELLQTLPEAQRVPVVLRYQESMSPDEIAGLLHQPLATVKSNLQRGLALLRRKAAVSMKEYVRDVR